MTVAADGTFQGIVPGQAAGTVVQFYVEGRDALGATSRFPAAGPVSRALIKFNDDQAQNGLAKDLRIVTTAVDATEAGGDRLLRRARSFLRCGRAFAGEPMQPQRRWRGLIQRSVQS